MSEIRGATAQVGPKMSRVETYTYLVRGHNSAMPLGSLSLGGLPGRPPEVLEDGRSRYEIAVPRHSYLFYPCPSLFTLSASVGYLCLCTLHLGGADSSLIQICIAARRLLA